MSDTKQYIQTLDGFYFKDLRVDEVQNNLDTIKTALVGYSSTLNDVNSANIQSHLNTPRSYILYSNPSGISGTITLNDTVENYDFVEIYGQFYDGTGLPYTKVETPSQKKVDLVGIATTTTSDSIGISVARLRLTLVGSSMSLTLNHFVTVRGTTALVESGTNRQLYITKVIGYKYNPESYNTLN